MVFSRDSWSQSAPGNKLNPVVVDSLVKKWGTGRGFRDDRLNGDMSLQGGGMVGVVVMGSGSRGLGLLRIAEHLGFGELQCNVSSAGPSTAHVTT